MGAVGERHLGTTRLQREGRRDAVFQAAQPSGALGCGLNPIQTHDGDILAGRGRRDLVEEGTRRRLVSGDVQAVAFLPALAEGPQEDEREIVHAEAQGHLGKLVAAIGTRPAEAHEGAVLVQLHGPALG